MISDQGTGEWAGGEFQLAPLTREEAEQTAAWRYEPELAVYDGSNDAIEAMLDPVNHYYSVRLHDRYLGYVCVGAEARVPGLAGETGIDDIGIGLAPGLVGRGLSRWLLPSLITALDELGVLTGHTLRAVVLDWNRRSLVAAERAGFESAGEHVSGTRRFVILSRRRP